MRVITLSGTVSHYKFESVLLTQIQRSLTKDPIAYELSLSTPPCYLCQRRHEHHGPERPVGPKGAGTYTPALRQGKGRPGYGRRVLPLYGFGRSICTTVPEVNRQICICADVQIGFRREDAEVTNMKYSFASFSPFFPENSLSPPLERRSPPALGPVEEKFSDPPVPVFPLVVFRPPFFFSKAMSPLSKGSSNFSLVPSAPLRGFLVPGAPTFTILFAGFISARPLPLM